MIQLFSGARNLVTVYKSVEQLRNNKENDDTVRLLIAFLHKMTKEKNELRDKINQANISPALSHRAQASKT